MSSSQTKISSVPWLMHIQTFHLTGVILHPLIKPKLLQSFLYTSLTSAFQGSLTLLLSLFLLVTILHGCGQDSSTDAHSQTTTVQEHWPLWVPSSAVTPLADEALIKYIESGTDFSRNISEYSTGGDYLNYSTTRSFVNSKSILLDAQGIPQTRHLDQWYYNPVTVAQYALTVYGSYLSGTASADQFLLAANRLLDLQDPDGSFRYPIPYRSFPPGWVSGLAQGQALSVFSRAYILTGSISYYLASESAFSRMCQPVTDGGSLASLESIDPSLQDYLVITEYPHVPPVYTLNGMLFAALGIYDWISVQTDANSRSAIQYVFETVTDSIENILPYYDLSGYSAHDLSHIVLRRTPFISPAPAYHAVHIYLLHALDTITSKPGFPLYRDRWSAFVRDDSPDSLTVRLTLKKDTDSPVLHLLAVQTASVPHADLQYRFSVRYPDRTWETIRPYSSACSASLPFSTESLSGYYFKVDVRNPDYSGDRQMTRIVKYSD